MILPSMYVFPNPVEADPEGQGLICIGADLEPSTLLKPTHMGYFLGLMKVIRSVGGVPTRVVSSIPSNITRVKHLFGV